MRILLQNPETKLYICPKENWTPSAHLAHDFHHSQKALDFVRRQNLKDVQLVVRFEDSQWDEIVPLPLVVAALAPRVSAQVGTN